MALLEINKLTMRFGGLTAVSQLDFQVEPGKIDSIIGPNGAGKTTAFNAITGIYQPTEGTIRFEGHLLRRPLTWKVLAGCALIGILTGLSAVVISTNVDQLWRATVKRQTKGSKHFSFTQAWRDAKLYFYEDLALEKLHDDRWTVVSADSEHVLAMAPTQEAAQEIKTSFDEMIGLKGSPATVVERDGQWQVHSLDGSRVLATFASREAAQDRLDMLARIAGKQARMRRTAWAALFLGLVLGSAGTLAIWDRARRTPDVISLGGIARTFQNIRLFQNMTVLENVLVGLDRSFHADLFSMLLRLPRVTKEEARGLGQATNLLQFVGLAAKASMLAKNLPYGDQRRLEIARALATSPRLLLLDEPAAGMNPAETGQLIELIRKIRTQGVTVLLIEHHMNVVMGISDRIAVLDYGVKIAEGTPEEVRRHPKVIEAYLGKEEVT